MILVVVQPQLEGGIIAREQAGHWSAGSEQLHCASLVLCIIIIIIIITTITIIITVTIIILLPPLLTSGRAAADLSLSTEQNWAAAAASRCQGWGRAHRAALSSLKPGMMPCPGACD